MKKFFTLIGALICSFLALTAFIIIYNNVLDKKIDGLYNDAVAVSYGNTIKNQGIKLQSYGIERHNFMLYGSSELGSNVPQNPRAFFPSEDNNFIVNSIGRGNVQSLEHAINFGALSKELKGKKVGFVVSLQWFLHKEGIQNDDFAMNFSELQFYKFMNNKNIDRDHKTYVAKRVYKLIEHNNEYDDLKFYALLYSNDNALSNVAIHLFKPYYCLKDQILTINDKIKTIESLKGQNSKVESSHKIKKIDWENERQAAEKSGKKVATNNEYNIENTYYDKYIRDNIKEIKGRYSDINLDNSLEYEDFDELLKICKEQNIKPCFIIMPVNGSYHDYLGLSKEMREGYYKRIEEMATSYGFEALNMTEKDYEPYFMIDSMHLGWKGWLYVDEKIAQYYNED